MQYQDNLQSRTFPVFYDPHSRRWHRFSLAFFLFGLVLVLIMGELIWSILISPQLPSLQLNVGPRFLPAGAVLAPISPTPTPRATPTATATPTPGPTGTNAPQPTARPANANVSALPSPTAEEKTSESDHPKPRPTPKPTKHPHKKGHGNRPSQNQPDPPDPPGIPSSGSPSRHSVAAPVVLPALAPTVTSTLAPTLAPTAAPSITPLPLLPARPGPRAQSEVIGFFVNWDEASFTSLQNNLTRLDKLIPEWLHLSDAQGNLAVDDPVMQAKVLALVRARRPSLPIMALVNNYDNQSQAWEGSRLAAMLGNPGARAHLIDNLLAFVRDNNLAGISIDFEEVPTGSQPALQAFMQELYARFHPLGLEVSQSIPLDDPDYNARALAASNDYLILMAYDEHASDTAAGPLASQNWFAAGLQHRLAETSGEHLVVALGNYGYDWNLKTKTAQELTFQESLQIASEAKTSTVLDPTSLNPFFSYLDGNSQMHQVWFLDAVTTFNQLAQAQPYGPRGFALWRLGSEDPALWSLLDHRNRLDDTVAQSLSPLHYGYDLYNKGQGEVIKVMSTPEPGRRDLTYDARTGLITTARVVSYPQPYLITHYGATDRKKIALTFDDGPNPQYTPRILDVLGQHHVPATFFVIGSQGALYPSLLQRMVSEGHEVGNHSFTHPDVSTISPEQLGLELNATQRLFESYLGRRSILFRPPYGEDVEPDTPAQLDPLVLTGRLGYFTVGMGVDPSDWQMPGVDAIVEQTINQVVSGDGQVILLHDGGGDRSQTVAALPRIIEGLQARGYQFVGISDLIGVSRNAVMPPLSSAAQTGARLNDAGFLLFGGFNWFVSTLFVVGILLGVARVLFISALAVRQQWQSRGEHYPREFQPSVAVLVPAYNEEKVIAQTVESLLRSEYPNFKILVVDDGSSDGTYRRVVEAFGDNPRVRALTQANNGKAEALNLGLREAQAEIVVVQDADTLLHPDAIGQLARHFADPRVGAVAGNAKVGNRLNLLTRWQALEYITSQNLDRRAFAMLNCITVVPGAIGAWRRDALLQVGGFANDTLPEDADLTMSLLQSGYRIEYEDRAVAYTEAPDNVRSFLKQRFRWTYGTLQAAWKHRETLFRPRAGALGMLALPNILIFQILFPLVAPLMDFMVLTTLFGLAWQRYQHPLDTSTDTLTRVLLFAGLFMLVDLSSALLAFFLERTEDWHLVGWLWLQRFLYRQLLYYVAWKAVLVALRGRIDGWGKLARKATVRAALGPSGGYE